MCFRILKSNNAALLEIFICCLQPFTKVTSPLGSIAWACRFKSCRAHPSEMTFGCQAAAQGAPASTAKVFLRSKSWPLTLDHDFVFEAIDLRCSSTGFVSR